MYVRARKDIIIAVITLCVRSRLCEISPSVGGENCYVRDSITLLPVICIVMVMGTVTTSYYPSATCLLPTSVLFFSFLYSTILNNRFFNIKSRSPLLSASSYSVLHRLAARRYPSFRTRDRVAWSQWKPNEIKIAVSHSILLLCG